MKMAGSYSQATHGCDDTTKGNNHGHLSNPCLVPSVLIPNPEETTSAMRKDMTDHRPLGAVFLFLPLSSCFFQAARRKPLQSKEAQWPATPVPEAGHMGKYGGNV